MFGSLHDKDICENILRETAIVMLESEEVDENFGNKALGITLVPTYVGKMTANPAVIFYKVNQCYWQDWDSSKLGLDNKDLGNSFLCSATQWYYLFLNRYFSNFLKPYRAKKESARYFGNICIPNCIYTGYYLWQGL